jgi:hypothetical protein
VRKKEKEKIRNSKIQFLGNQADINLGSPKKKKGRGTEAPWDLVHGVPSGLKFEFSFNGATFLTNQSLT